MGNLPATPRLKLVKQGLDAWVERVKSPRTRVPFHSDREVEAAEALIELSKASNGSRRPEDPPTSNIGQPAIPVEENASRQKLPDQGSPVIDTCPGRDAGFHLESCIFGGRLEGQPPGESRRPPSTQRIRSSSCFSSPDLPPLPGKMFPDLDELPSRDGVKVGQEMGDESVSLNVST